MQRELRKRKARKRRRAMTAVLITVLVLGVGGFFVSNFAGSMIKSVLPGASSSAEVTDYPGPGTGEVEISVNQGDTGEDIATTLKDNGVVASRTAYLNAASTEPAAQSIQPGTYALKEQMAAADALKVLVDPANRLDYIVTIPEGWTVEQVNTKLQTVMGVTPEQIAEGAKDTQTTGLPKAAGGNYEGWLASGQYVFARDTSVAQVYKQMVSRQVKVLDDLGADKSEREEILIKASIVQREGQADVYSKVARVIENRLKAGQALQMDTTVGYGAGKDVMTLTQADFTNKSNKYNTYVHTGLTPTPIANPSEDAISAVLKPANGDWMYFVTVNLDTGETKFATTWNEFQKYVAEYREWKAKNYTADSDEG
ncbi:endolytic transglycosylase MltG [Rarobacter incanus]